MVVERDGEVKKVTYLGFKFKRSEGQEGSVRERMKKRWDNESGMGKRRFEGNWKRGMELFDWLVGSVVGFGADIREWNRKKWKGYMRRVLRVDERVTEIYSKRGRQKEKMRTKMGSRAVRYEKRLEKEGDSKWARKCWEKVKEKGGEDRSEQI